MSTFKQKSLFAALAGLGVLGVVDSAQAVHINADGLGQALVYPYYTARTTTGTNNYVTALSVVNTTSSAKAVKVRFLEGKNSQEVLDFNLFLSAYDVWTAGVVPNGPRAGLFTADNSCTLPTVSASAINPTPFRNGQFASDAAGGDLDRTYEGYFEILEMNSIVSGTSLETAVTHVANSSAANASKPSCAGNNTALAALARNPAFQAPPSGGLFGGASLINVNEGTDYSYDAVALDGWSTIVQYSEPGVVTPQIRDAFPAVSIVINNTTTGGQAIRTNWGIGAAAQRNAVSAVMMRSNVFNEYTVEPLIKAATDWVVTMPTKQFFVTATNATPPFQNNFTSKGSCDTIDLIYYDREEQTPGSIIDFSPTTPESRSLCWEANVLTFTGNGGAVTVSNVLQSKNVQNVALNNPWINGWANLSFPNPVLTGSATAPSTLATAHTLVAPSLSTTFIDLNSVVQSGLTSATYFGLPVVGFMVQSFVNGSLAVGSTTVLSNYGGNFNHKFKRLITIGANGG
jgi:hypothetical protein